MAHRNKNQQQLVCTIAFVTILAHFFGHLVQASQAATSGSSQQQTENAQAASTQPLWSYQVKPTNYVGATQAGQNAPYATGPYSIFDAFTGLSQRQGALTSGGSPFLSILPIILIAAGGLLLLLPMLTMMMASPFGGGAFGNGGYQNYGAYPQVGLNKRRSLDQVGSGGSGRGMIELIEHVSSTIEELTRKYSAGNNQQVAGAGQQPNGSSHQPNKRSKALNGGSQTVAATMTSSTTNYHHQQPGGATANISNELPQVHPANHKPAPAAEPEASNTANSVSNLISSGQ